MAQMFRTKFRDVYSRRIDPRFHLPEFVANRKNIRSRTYDSVLRLCDLSNETWDGESLFNETFPYIEISAVDCQDGAIKELIDCPVDETPSRAKMIVRANDLLVSATRPTRNAITRVPCSIPLAIASTGFFVIRKIDSDIILRDYLFHALRFEAITKQFDQFSSGGNYPAINKDDLQRVIIPLPPLPIQRKIVAELDAAYAAKRKADREAAALLASIDDMVLDELGIAKLPPRDTSLATRVFTVSLKDVVEDRLDAIAYQQRKVEFYRNARQGKYDAQVLGSLVEVRREQTDTVYDQPYVGLENINSEDGSYFGSGDKETCSSAMVFSRGQILFPKLRPYLNKVWLAEFDGVASTEFVPLQATGVDSEYLVTFLRMGIVAETMGVLMTGNTLPRVQPKDILALPIPVPSKSVQERIIRRAGEIKAKAKKLKATAAAQLAAAKNRIELDLMGPEPRRSVTKQSEVSRERP